MRAIPDNNAYITQSFQDGAPLSKLPWRILPTSECHEVMVKELSNSLHCCHGRW
jgi:hypothetical protein